MPRPVRELLERQRTITERVLAFLQQQSDSAFTAVEIAAALEAGGNRDAAVLIQFLIAASQGPERRRFLDRWEQALAELEAQGAVRAFQENASTYYACAEEPK